MTGTHPQAPAPILDEEQVSDAASHANPPHAVAANTAIRRARWLREAALACLALAFFAWVVLWQYSLYVSKFFGYHDLTLINDWFSNAIVHGRPFWLTNANRSHLTIHLTPSLILLTPAFLFFHGQFALIAIAAFAVCTGIYVATRDQQANLTKLSPPTAYVWILTVTFFVMAAGNRYTARVLSSAHFEPVFVLGAVLLLNGLRRGAGWWQLVLLLLLALGIRQDAGLFLFFLLLSCLVAPRAWGACRPREIAALSLGCLIYVALAAKVIMPQLGYSEGTRFWHLWGDTWPQVFMAWFTSPARVYQAVVESEFSAWNREFDYLTTLNPLAWLANQLPAVLFYTADAIDKRFLKFYNTSFLLPGTMLCLAFTQLHAVRFVMSRTVTKPAFRHVGLTVICAAFAYGAFEVVTREPRDKDETLQVDSLTRTDPFVREPLRDIVGCKQVRSVAADFHNIVYIPLRLDKYLLENEVKADVVVIPRKFDKHLPYAVKEKYLVRTLSEDGGYTLAARMPDVDVYAREAALCKPLAQTSSGR